MKKYDNYKDSGVEWIGEIPSNWNVKKLKFVCKIFNGDSLKDEEKELYSQEIENSIPYVSTKDIDVWTAKINYENGLKIPVDHSKYKIAPKNSFLMCIEGGSAGRKYAHLQRDVFFVNKLACFETQSENNKFLYYYSQSPLFQSQFQNSLSGLIGGVAISQIRNFSVILPIPDEQTAIANYLDQKTTQIDDLIAKKERLIQLLEEERTAIINQAVTKGLDPTVPMKDSGIKWLGEIPAHWEVKKLKYCFDIIGGYAFNSSDFQSMGIQLVKIGNLYQNQLQLDRQPTFLPLSFKEIYSNYLVKKNDILLSLTGTLGKRDYGYAILIDKDEELLINQRVAKITAKSNISIDFAINMFQSETYLNRLFSIPTGTKQGNLSGEDVLSIIMGIPSLDEQINIAKYITIEQKRINNIISKTQQEIELLKEYKTALISEVVTGKIDVRNEKLN
jgi:type I restriction enzyme S subunit